MEQHPKNEEKHQGTRWDILMAPIVSLGSMFTLKKEDQIDQPDTDTENKLRG
ncbi:hypothetical protein [Tepidibacillus fermentans]|uniref:Uncharacterized protein n=1 Tax=Tepidibacillus fermentans TaxID=1281767 RepID=A0A4R3KIP7_9BACI|nr:hypothetical protein [Tepidibacillus fermentans]TCS83082.1 hypothetical protein EDD72_1068 [Tepidibacillus fermentans]